MDTIKKEKPVCPKCNKNKVFCKGLCHSCYTRKLEKENPEILIKKKDYIKQWKINNKEKIKETDRKRDAIRRQNKDYKDKKKSRELFKKYGITLEDFRKILLFQNNKCAICEVELGEGIKYTHIDHCHVENRFRGILCSQCNWFMSKIDNVEKTFENLSNYIKNKGILWKKPQD